jgi:hypothetical protein
LRAESLAVKWWPKAVKQKLSMLAGIASGKLLKVEPPGLEQK